VIEQERKDFTLQSMWKELSNMCSASLKLDVCGWITFTTEQYLLLGIQHLPCKSANSLVHIDLIDFTGFVSLLVHRNFEPLKSTAQELLSRLQALTGTTKEMSTHQFYAETVIRMYGKRILYQIGESDIRGLFEGLWYKDKRRYLQIQGGVSVLLDIRKLANFSASLEIEQME
jgi:hypothetical protein